MPIARSTSHLATPDVASTVSEAPAASESPMVDGWRTAHLLILAALMVMMVMAAFLVLSLRTGNHWDAAPLCAAGQVGRRCVTEVSGALSPKGLFTCDSNQYGQNCSDLPVDLTFEDGTTRHMVLKQDDRLFSALSGGQRYLGVVPQNYAPVVGRFYRDHLVELVFPSTRTHLATDDFPGHTINGLAQAGLVCAPFVGILIVGLVAWRVHKRQRGRSMTETNGDTASHPDVDDCHSLASLTEPKWSQG